MVVVVANCHIVLRHAVLSARAVTPPGFYTVPGSGSTLKCPAGSFRAGWAAAGAASECEPCGVGVSAITDAFVEDLSPANISTSIAVTTLSSSCCKLPVLLSVCTALLPQWLLEKR